MTAPIPKATIAEAQGTAVHAEECGCVPITEIPDVGGISSVGTRKTFNCAPVCKEGGRAELTEDSLRFL
jgi:hypothetical protein